jgi:hypothetical protein
VVHRRLVRSSIGLGHMLIIGNYELGFFYMDEVNMWYIISTFWLAINSVLTSEPFPTITIDKRIQTKLNS